MTDKTDAPKAEKPTTAVVFMVATSRGNKAGQRRTLPLDQAEALVRNGHARYGKSRRR